MSADEHPDLRDPAFFVFDGIRHYKAIWWVESRERDWLCMMWREPGGPWRFRYRWRHYADKELWGSKDRKSGQEGEADGPHADDPDYLAAQFDKMAGRADPHPPHEYEDDCPGCQPTLCEFRDGEAVSLADDHPRIVAMRKVWARLTLEQKRAINRVWAFNGRDPQDLAVLAAYSERCKKEFAKS